MSLGRYEAELQKGDITRFVACYTFMINSARKSIDTIDRASTFERVGVYLGSTSSHVVLRSSLLCSLMRRSTAGDIGNDENGIEEVYSTVAMAFSRAW